MGRTEQVRLRLRARAPSPDRPAPLFLAAREGDQPKDGQRASPGTRKQAGTRTFSSSRRSSIDRTRELSFENVLMRCWSSAALRQPAGHGRRTRRSVGWGAYPRRHRYHRRSLLPARAGNDVNSCQREQDGIVYHAHFRLLTSGTFDTKQEAVWPVYREFKEAQGRRQSRRTGVTAQTNQSNQAKVTTVEASPRNLLRILSHDDR